MLRSLQVRNYVLISALDVSFPEGLIIITGQTGAGKSVLLGALSLALGAKADASAVGAEGDSLVVEACFEVPSGDPSLERILQENEVECEGRELIVRRVVNRSGRSRSFLNDMPVNVGVLSELAGHLVDVHSQHQTLRLADRHFPLEVLDLYAGTAPDAAACRNLWSTLRQQEALRDALVERIRRSEAERDYNQAQFERLEAAALRDGELEELEAEQRRLSHAEEVREALEVAANAFSSPDDNLPGVDVLLKEAVRSLEKVTRFLPQAEDLSRRLESARVEVGDIADGVDALIRSTEVSPERLSQVEERLSLLYTLLKKHGCASVADLIAVRDGFSELLYDADALGGELSSLEKQMASTRKEYEALCGRLGKARREAAPRLAVEIRDTLRFLELERAELLVKVSDTPEGPLGTDSVSMLFSAGGLEPQDIAKAASGGELSRIMLSLKAIMARYRSMPTLVFDEIDAGVSGSVADKMGQLICRMSADMQVFAITHLPQVAAKGQAHYLVEKALDEKGRAVSVMRPLTGEQRVMEVARMLSGSRISEAAVENAKTLLAE